MHPRGLAQLRYAMEVVPGRLAAISRSRAARKDAPGSWSAKQELGHLIDSAANNHQRDCSRATREQSRAARLRWRSMG